VKKRLKLRVSRHAEVQKSGRLRTDRAVSTFN
jgi:hypothetical protein